jgi:hypothetical protein
MNFGLDAQISSYAGCFTETKVIKNIKLNSIFNDPFKVGMVDPTHDHDIRFIAANFFDPYCFMCAENTEMINSKLFCQWNKNFYSVAIGIGFNY